MKIKNFIYLIIFSLVFTSNCYANWYKDIVDRIEITNQINSNILRSQNASLNAQQNILTSQKDIESLMKQVHASVTGNSGWGTYNSHDYQSYGDAARNWSGVMQMTQNGMGNGDLGQAIKALAKEFPIEKNTFNNGITDPRAQRYYEIESQTILAQRAAGQLDYNKVQDQIGHQQMLQGQIENTKDLKAAVDLNNRIQVESNLINLEILRQQALSNQQQALFQQASVNSALTNAKFLSKERR